MFKTIKTFLRDKIFFNPWAVAASAFIFVALIGPHLVSAADTISVLVGIVGIVVTNYWLYIAIANKLNK